LDRDGEVGKAGTQLAKGRGIHIINLVHKKKIPQMSWLFNGRSYKRGLPGMTSRRWRGSSRVWEAADIDLTSLTMNVRELVDGKFR
jgi:hypothetical protein